ncbi:MAG: hypothetical protein IH621_16825 [Krumholzibacteria bacterium]|nr:hypothetical protein [Candidatus Krumholzibacteria bacterium]
MARLVAAVIAGFVLWSAVWIAAQRVVVSVVPEAFGEDAAVASTGVLLLFLAVSVVGSLVSGWVAALVARESAGRAVPILAAILLGTGLVFEIGGWSLAPAWYHVLFLLLLVPATLAGARLRAAAKGLDG